MGSSKGFANADCDTAITITKTAALVTERVDDTTSNVRRKNDQITRELRLLKLPARQIFAEIVFSLLEARKIVYIILSSLF